MPLLIFFVGISGEHRPIFIDIFEENWQNWHLASIWAGMLQDPLQVNYFTLAIARQTTGFTRDQLNKLSYRAPYFEQTVELIHSHKKFHGNTSNIFRSPRNILELWISGLFLLPLRIPATTLHQMTDKTILV